MASLGKEPIKKVLIMIAMKVEAQLIIDALGLALDNPPLMPDPAPCKSYSGEYASMSVMLVQNGTCMEHSVDNVGTVPAAIASYLAIQAFQPQLIISAGTAGGFKSQGGEIGDIYLSSMCMNHDRRIPVPGFEAYGLGKKQSVSTKNLQLELGLKSGTVSSGNSFDSTEKCLEIMKENSVCVKEMEASAIAWVADLWSIPMFCVKAITDMVDTDSPAVQEFQNNLAAATKALETVMPRILTFVANKQLSQL